MSRPPASPLDTWLSFRREALRSLFVRWHLMMRGVYVGEGTRIPGGGELAFSPAVTIQRMGVLNARRGAAIRIGRGSRIGAFAVLSAAQEIDIGEDVLVADRVFITDHQHESADLERPVIHQGVGGADPVHVGAGCWLGINVCLMPGVRLGPGCIVGAGSVVTRSFEAGSVIVGAPARLVRSRLAHDR